MLARRFAIYVLLPTLALVAGGAFAGYFIAATNLEHRIDTDLSRKASALDLAIGRRIDSIGGDLIVMNSFRELGEFLQLVDVDSLTQADERLVALEENYVRVASLKPDCRSFRYFDLRGNSRINIVDRKRSYRVVNVANETWFRAALAHRPTDEQDKWVVSRVASGADGSAAKLTVALPVRHDGRVRAVLAAEIEIGKLVAELFPKPLLKDGGYVYLVDSAARVVASGGEGVPTGDAKGEHAAERAAAGYALITSGPNRDGEQMRIAYTASTVTDLGIVIGAPYRRVFAPVYRMRIVVLPVLLVGFLAIACIALWLVGRIVQPVQLLTEGAGRIAEGQLDLTLTVETGDEIEELANSFNRMTRNLLAARESEENKNSELRAAVAAEERRTAELETAYGNLQDTQRRLAQSEKLGMLGQLAGGIAHDFNNLLGGILGCADLLRKGAGTPTERDNYVDMIIETSHRATELVRQLLAFARPAPTKRLPINVHDLIDNVIGILQHTIDPRITVRTRLAAGGATVEGDHSELQSALLNLGLNARDAMPEGGKLTFTTADMLLDPETCDHYAHSVEPGRYVEIGVSDNGVGMTREVVEHIFEPFFTTKQVGSGTGLGLAAVYGTVQGHDGMVTVYSEPGEGTLFKLLLPLSSKVAVPAGAPSPEIVRGSGRILVVDDEKVIRRLVRDMLRSLGYDVVTAAGGEEALSLYRAEGARIHLVVLDLVMPGMNGNEVLRALKRINPDVRVLIASGFHLDVDIPEIQREGASGILPKPFVVASLSQAVAAVMEGEGMDGGARTGDALRVLLVEDSAVNRQVVSAQLANLGHTCVAVEDGEAAVERALQEEFDLVLMDMHLPGMSGCAAAESIRAHERDVGGRVPIIALTGLDAEEDREQARESGMDGFLVKPVGLDTLRERIARITPPGADSPEPPKRAEDAQSRLRRRIADAFLEEGPRLLDDVEAAVAGADAHALHHAAHTLYGSLRHFDAATASDLADRLQQMGRSGTLQEAAPLAEELHTECDRLSRFLRADAGGHA